MSQLALISVVLAALPPVPGAGETAVRLAIHPMAAPRPAMKYQLLPDLAERKPGNGAQYYVKCFLEQRPFFYSQQGVAERTRYRKMSLIELRLENLGEYGGNALGQADWAARLDTLDWQALPRVRDGGFGRLPAEVPPLQILAEGLQIRFRSEVAAWRFDDAIRTAKTMCQMGRDLGEHPTEVGGLLGLWVAHLGLSTVEEMIQQAGCPNLYWALTDLPSPLVEVRKGVQGERIRVAADLRPIRVDAPMTEAELAAFVGRLSGMMSLAREQAGRPPRNLRARLRAMAGDEAKVAAARRRLVDAGSAPDLVKTFAPLQAILLDEKRDYEFRRDERIKLLALPAWQLDRLAGCDGPGPGPDGEGLLADLLPRIVKLRREQAALDRQVALLRHVEALRLYAAEHGGKLPASPSDVPVPLPDDPLTGRPFAYTVEGATAHIRGGPPGGEGRGAGAGVDYEIVLLK